MKKFVFLFIFLLLSYGLTLKMNFWRDDYSMLFKLQHPAEQAGHFGKGLVGAGSYKYILLPHAFFYPLFQFNPTGYFVIGLLLYAFAMYSLYLLTNELLKNKKAAIFTSLVFAAGYIASDGLFRIINSWQNSYEQILILLIAWAYVRYFNKKGIKYYFAALLLYLISIEFVYVRSHGTIAMIVAIDLILGLIPNLSEKAARLKSEFLKFVARVVPFGLLFYLWYFKNGAPEVSGIKDKLFSIFLGGNFGQLTPLFANIGNVLVPDQIQSLFISSVSKLFLKSEAVDGQVFWFGMLVTLIVFIAIYLFARLASVSRKYSLVMLLPLTVAMVVNLKYYYEGLYWYQDTQTVTFGLLGIDSLIFSLFVFVALWNKNRKAGTAVFLGWIILASQVFAYYIYYSGEILGSTHRYLSNAFVGYCLFLGGLATFFLTVKPSKNASKIRYLALTILFLLVLTNLKLNIDHELKFVNEISTPSINFYRQLKSAVPAFEKGSLFYFDIKDSAFYQHQFDEFFSVGSMPNSTAIADYYNVDRYDFLIDAHFIEFLK